jgi:hypothetical protein
MGFLPLCVSLLVVGIKYALNETYQYWFFEILHRFTNTDYLDDVSMTYVKCCGGIFLLDPDGSASNGYFTAWTVSYELGDPIGIDGRQRGNDQQKRSVFVTAMFHVTFNLQSL